MAIKKGLLKNNTNPDGYYPYTQVDCVFDDDGNSLEQTMVMADELGAYSQATPINADMLEGNTLSQVLEQAQTFEITNSAVSGNGINAKWVRKGDIVQVYVNGALTKAISAYQAILQGLPKPAQINGNDYVAAIVVQLDKGSGVYVNGNGELTTSVAISNSTYLFGSGTYII